MSTLREQFSAVRKAQVETQLDFVRHLTSKVVESTGQVVALNLSTSRASIEKSADGLRKLFTATSPRELAELSAQPQAGFDTLLSYGRELFSIASRAQADLLKAAAPAAVLPSLPPFRSTRVEVDVRADIPGTDGIAVAGLIEAPAPVLAPEPAPQEQAIDVALSFAAEEPKAEPQAELKAEPQAEPQVAAPAIEVIEEVPLPGDAVKANPLAQAVSDALPQEDAPVIAASPLITSLIADLHIDGMEPVDASRPHAPSSGNPMAQDKPHENGSTKSRKKRS